MITRFHRVNKENRCTVSSISVDFELITYKSYIYCVVVVFGLGGYRLDCE